MTRNTITFNCLILTPGHCVERSHQINEPNQRKAEKYEHLLCQINNTLKNTQKIITD